MAMVGGILAALWFGKNDPGFIHNGPLAGLVAVCAGSDVMHPIGSLFVGLIAGWIFVKLFTIMQQTKKIDDVLGVWPLHGVCGAWGGIAAGIFGLESLGGMGGVAFSAQVIGTVAGIVVALVGGLVVYGLVSKVTNIRLTDEEEFKGADLSIHSIGSVNHD
jgi:Amt family ammonium transporter